MTSCTSCGQHGTSPAIVVRGVDVAVLGKLLEQQRREGRATVALVRGAAVQGAEVRGAPEPGKGTLVDLLA